MPSIKKAKPSSANGSPMMAPEFFVKVGQSRLSSNSMIAPETHLLVEQDSLFCALRPFCQVGTQALLPAWADQERHQVVRFDDGAPPGEERLVLAADRDDQALGRELRLPQGTTRQPHARLNLSFEHHGALHQAAHAPRALCQRLTIGAHDLLGRSARSGACPPLLSQPPPRASSRYGGWSVAPVPRPGCRRVVWPGHRDSWPPRHGDFRARRAGPSRYQRE